MGNPGGKSVAGGGSGGGCLPRATLVSYVEGSLGGEESARIQEHLQGCDLCRSFHGEIEREVTSVDLSISLVWQEERVSCPHRDILKAYLSRSLGKGEADYVEFHLTEIGCTLCNANLDDLRAMFSEDESRYLSAMRERLSQSTSAFLRKS